MPEQIPTKTEETPKREVEKHEPDLKELGHLFFLSYKFSQGSGVLQRIIFRYLRAKHADWVLIPEFLQKLKDQVLPRFYKYMEKGLGIVHSSADAGGGPVLDEKEISVKNSVTPEVDQLGKVWDSSEIFDANMTIKQLADSIISSDHSFLTRPGGRNKEMGERYHPDRDPFLSHLVYYGFLGHDTGSKDYNDMFREITEWIKEKFKQKTLDVSLEDAGNLTGLIIIWNEKHPSMQFNIELLDE